MTDTEYNRKLDELDRLLNDPTVPMQPARIWDMLAEVAERGEVNSFPNQSGILYSPPAR